MVVAVEVFHGGVDEWWSSKGFKCLHGELSGNRRKGRREVEKDQGGVFVLERVVVGPMVDVDNVGDHRSLGDKSPLVFVDVWSRDPFPSDSASCRKESVVGV